MKKLFVLAVLSFLYTFGIAKTNLDSLLMQVEQAKEKTTFENLLETSSKLSDTNPVSGAQLNRKIYKRAVEKGFKDIQIQSLIELGKNLLQQDKYDSTITTLIFAGEVYDETPKLNLLQINYYKANGLYYLGEYSLAISLLLNNLKLQEVKADEQFYYEVLHLLGEIYRASDNLVASLDYLEKALTVAEKIGSQNNIARTLNRKGVVYYQKGEHDLAEEFLTKSLTISRENQLEKTITTNLNDLGELYFATKEYDKCIALYEEALERNPSPSTRVNTLNNIARLDRDLGNYEKAIQNAKEALALAEELNILTYKVDATKIIADSYESMQDFQNASIYYNAYIELQESLFEIEKNWQIVELEVQYQAQQKEQEIAILREREAAERERKWLYLVILIIVAVLMLVLVFLFSQIRKKNKDIEAKNNQLEELNITKDKFFSIIAHDLRSPMIALQGIGKKLEYYIKKDKQDKLLQMGGKMDKTINQLNHLLNNLLNWAVSQTGAVPHHPSVLNSKELIEENLALYKTMAEAKNIELVNKLEEVEVYADANTMSAIIRNIISNAIKFTKPKGRIVVSTKSNDNTTEIRVTDEGEGMTKEKIEDILTSKAKSTVGSNQEKGFGLGLKISEEFVMMNNGKIEVQSIIGKGTTFILSFPKHK